MYRIFLKKTSYFYNILTRFLGKYLIQKNQLDEKNILLENLRYL
jgi:hypothetical protein